jgi:hypothetical protein
MLRDLLVDQYSAVVPDRLHVHAPVVILLPSLLAAAIVEPRIGDQALVILVLIMLSGHVVSAGRHLVLETHAGLGHRDRLGLAG